MTPTQRRADTLIRLAKMHAASSTSSGDLAQFIGATSLKPYTNNDLIPAELG